MSAVHDNIRRAAQRINPDAFLPVNSYDPETGIFFLDDGYLGVCYWGDPVNGADDQTADMLRSAFSLPLPEGSFIQVSLIGMPDIDRHVAAYRDRRQQGVSRLKNPVTRRVIEEYAHRRAEFISKARSESNIPTVGVKMLDRKVFVTLKIPFTGMFPTDRDMDAVAESGAKLAESLQVVGLFLTRMTDQQYLTLAYRLTHPFEPPKTDSVRSDQLLKEQVFVPGESIDVEVDRLVFNDDTTAQMLSVGRWPKGNDLSLMAYMLGDPLGANNQIKLPYHINLTLHYPEQYSKRSTIKQKSAFTNYQAFGPLLRFVPKLLFKKQGLDVLVNAVEQGATVVEACFTINVYGREREECIRQIAALKTYMQSFDFNMGEEKRVMLPAFWNSFPLFPTAESIKNTFRFKTLAVEQAMTFSPMLGEWKGTATGKPGTGHAMLLQSRRGQVMSLDLYDSPTNYNGVVFAAAGSGKSFFTQAMIADYLSMGAKVWVIDVGRSYLKLAKMLGGSFIEFGPDSGLSLNPFSRVVDIDEEIGLIKALIEKMAAPVDGLEDWARSRLEEAIKSVWGTKAQATTITDIAEYLSLQDDPRMKDIGDMLFQFTRNGSEGYWFDGKSNIDLDRDMVVLELEELKGKKVLQQLVLMQLISSIQREMYLSTDGRPKILIIDEAWDLLNDPIISRFMEDAYRRFRKYGGSAIVVTQSIADLYGSPSGVAIAANSAFKFILRQNPETIQQVKKNEYLALGEYGFYLLGTVHSMPGKYSEVLMYTDQGMGLARLVVDRFTQVLFSTSGNERTEVINSIEKGVDPVDAVEDYIATYG
ncbi:type IV secretion system protein TraC [Acidovorax sp. sic0104]|uniref:type IV secretion system protein TraC n=1 Tax=Acidovorax sp. sic0104 TaxID=2854784 RepID=UPI001C455942|nr:type IV secretion system protein TraC [Acidovorax sp. sic0104]MBV7542106.1 type IV secretion system protein TraC [Acidovorax sp. sic0104]